MTFEVGRVCRLVKKRRPSAVGMVVRCNQSSLDCVLYNFGTVLWIGPDEKWPWHVGGTKMLGYDSTEEWVLLSPEEEMLYTLGS